MANEDPDYVAWVRTRPCRLCGGLGPCHAHHSTTGVTASGLRRGKGQKAHDHETIPLHIRCHAQFHGLSGPCRGWTKEQMRQWQAEQVVLMQAEYEAQVGPRDWVASGPKPSAEIPRILPRQRPELTLNVRPGPAVVLDLAQHRTAAMADRTMTPVLVVFCDVHGETIYLNERVGEPLTTLQILGIIDELSKLADSRG